MRASFPLRFPGGDRRRLLEGCPRPALLAAAVVLIGLQGAALAQPAPFPNRPIRLIVPYGAGGPADILARITAQKLSENLGQPMIVENRPGATGAIGSEAVANAAPDGYTLLASTIGPLSMTPHVLRKVSYNALTSFTAVSGIAFSTSVISVGGNQPMKTVKDVVAFARANPGKLIYGTSGIGSIGHLAGEVLSQTTGVTMTHVPFKTAGQAYPDMMTGTLNMIIDTLPSAMNHIKSGTARPVAMLSPGRNAMFPDVPTIAEAGFPDATLVFWSAVHGPAGMNPAVVQRLHDAMVKSLAAPDLRERFAALGAEPWVAAGKDVDTRARRDYDSLGKVIKAAGIKQE